VRIGRKARPRLDAHQQQRCDDRKVADAVEEKTPALAEGRDHKTGNRWSNEPRAVGHRRVDGYGVAQVVAIYSRAVGHHLNQERLPSRHVEGVDDSL